MNGPHHINTDLELESLEDLTPIVAAFGTDVVVLFHGEAMGHRRASFEVSGLVADPDALLNHFCMIAEALSAPERAVWDRCSKKVFDIGYQCATGTTAFQSQLRARTVQRVAALGASVVITMYPQSS